MSELAAKLARRRALNGEEGVSPSLCPASSTVNTYQLEKAAQQQKNVQEKKTSGCAIVSSTEDCQEAAPTREKAEQEEKLAREKAEQEEKAAREKAEQEEKLAREKAEQEEKAAREKAEQEDKEKREKAAREKAEQEEKAAREKAEQEEKLAREKAEQEEKAAREKAEQEDKEKREKAAREKAEQEEKAAREKAEQEDKEKREKAAREKAEQEEKAAREKAEQEEKAAREKAEQEDKEKREKLAREKAEQEEKLAREKAEQEDKEKREKLAREKAEQEEKASREKAEQEDVEKREKAAREKAEQEEKVTREKADQETEEKGMNVKAIKEKVAERIDNQNDEYEFGNGSDVADVVADERSESETKTVKSTSTNATESGDSHQESGDVKVDDELKELESFFDNMTEDSYIMDGINVDTPQMTKESSTQSISEADSEGLFADDSVYSSSDGGRIHELTSLNNKLKSDLIALTNEISVKDAQIKKIEKQKESFAKRAKNESLGSIEEPNDDGVVTEASRFSYKKPRKSTSLFADDAENEVHERCFDSMTAEELVESNNTLNLEIAAAKQDIARKKEIILSSQKELDSVRKSLLQNSGHCDSTRGSMSAQALLQSNLDYMGFDSENIVTLMDVQQENNGNEDEDNIFGFSGDDLKVDDKNKLDGLLSTGDPKKLGLGLESDYWANQRNLQQRLNGIGLEGNEESEQLGALARQKMNVHGLFGSSDSDTVENTDIFRDSDIADKKQKSESDKKIYHYHEFMNKVMHPDHTNIALAIHRFLLSVLGPTNDCQHPPPGAKLEYEFHGVSRLASRCDDFISTMIDHFREAPGWSGDTDERYSSARDCLERFIMSHIHKYAFESVRSPAEDEELLSRMKLLSFVPATALDIKPELVNDLVFAIARDELNKINSYALPADKIACITRCASVIFRSLNLARAKGEDNDSALGADDFLPVFILVVMRSQVPQLFSNCEYIQSFHSPDHMRGRAGYCFVNLRSAMEFILSATSEDLSMDPDEFNMKLKEAKENLTSS